MSRLVNFLKYQMKKGSIMRKHPRYSFQKDKSEYLMYSKDIPSFLRKFLNNLIRFLDWIIEKRNKNDALNRRILDSIGVDPETDITSLDAFYKREFQKKKYMHFFKVGVTKNLPEPPSFLFEYMPKIEQKNKQVLFKDSLSRAFKERKRLTQL